MRADNSKLLTWLNYYGLLRKQGVVPGEADRISRLDDEGRIEYFNALSQTGLMAAAQSAAAQAAGQDLAKAVMSAIPFATVLTSFLDIATAIITPFFKINKQQGCDESKCKGNVDYDRRHYTGIYPPPGRRWPGSGAGRPIQYAWNDGYVFPTTPSWFSALPTSGRFTEVVFSGYGDGVDDSGTSTINGRTFDTGRDLGSFVSARKISSSKSGETKTNVWEMTPLSKLYPGSAIGCQAIRYWWESSVSKFRNKTKFPKVLQGVIPEGSKSNAWDSPRNSFWYRTWAATRLLRWLQDAVPCRNLICLASVVQGFQDTKYTPGLLDDPLTGMKLGSLWFASVYYMHKDFNDLATAKGASNVQSILSKIGASSAAAAVATRSQGGSQEHPYNWSWYPVSKKLSFAQLQQMLGLLSMQTATISPLALSLLQQGRVQLPQNSQSSNQAGASSVNPLLLLGGLSAGALLLYALLKR
jgi:hypothetical protein